jgi:hypothetical protein
MPKKAKKERSSACARARFSLVLPFKPVMFSRRERGRERLQDDSRIAFGQELCWRIAHFAVRKNGERTRVQT